MPYTSVHLLEERLAPLVALLVVANQPQLLDVHLVVAGYWEGSRLRRRPHRSCRSTCRGAGRPAAVPTRPAVVSPYGRLLARPPGCFLLPARCTTGSGRRRRLGTPRRPRRTPGPTPARSPAVWRPARRVAGHPRGGPRLLPKVAHLKLGGLSGALLLALCRLGRLTVDEPVLVGEGSGEAGGHPLTSRVLPRSTMLCAPSLRPDGGLLLRYF